MKKKTKYKIQRKVKDENSIEYIVQDKIRVRIAGWRIVIADSYSVGNRCKIKDGFQFSVIGFQLRKIQDYSICQSASQNSQLVVSI